MKNYTKKYLDFPRVKKRKIRVNFEGGEVTSDAGSLLLKQAEEKLNLLKKASQFFIDERDPSKIRHKILTMLSQRVFGIALGYEDLNDHTFLRKDTVIQTSVNQEGLLASSSTLCRLEKTAERNVAVSINKELVETFIRTQDKAPDELYLDFDATDDIVHGKQEGSAYHGYYRNYCFLPLYVFCGSHLLVSYLRQSNQDPAKHSWAIFALLVKRFREEWPHVNIIFRGDGAFSRHKMFNWIERKQAHYITGIGSNNRLKKIIEPWVEKAKMRYEQTSEKQCLFTEFTYAAGTWSRERKIIAKIEYNDLGSNVRFIVTNINGNPQDIYQKIYCARGDMENRIKEQQLSLFSDRTSSSFWWSNQLRMLFSSLAYVLMNYIRTHALENTDFKNAQCSTIRLKLFKIGAVVVKKAYSIFIMISSSYPYQDLFEHVYRKLVPS